VRACDFMRIETLVCVENIARPLHHIEMKMQEAKPEPSFIQAARKIVVKQSVK